ncbi:MAG: sel1 repeat family protein [Nitrospira sp.]|nr:sel1 repeat family protein [Nitrospira sp.]
MAKKGYPGLVLVPPSDRTILKRRLLHGALFIIALVWGASTLGVWPPASDDKTNCQPGVGQEDSNSSAETCGQPQSDIEPLPNQKEFSLTTVSQAEGLGASQDSTPASPLAPDQLTTQDNRGKDSKSTQPSSLADQLSEHNVVPPDSEKAASRVPASTSARNPESDVRLADRLATQHNSSQDSKPKSSEPAGRTTDRNAGPPGIKQSASSPPPSTSAPNQELDARLAEQGDAFAQYRLGRYYAQRDGRQTPEAVSWYKKASPGLHRLAETGNGQAMYVLGVMYAYGRGVTRSTDEARRWLTWAVEHKISAAQPVLAKLAVQPHPNLKTAEQAKNLKLQN